MHLYTYKHACIDNIYSFLYLWTWITRALHVIAILKKLIKVTSMFPVSFFLEIRMVGRRSDVLSFKQLKKENLFSKNESKTC